MKKQIEQTLDSREVAEMVGKRHDNLVRDIKGYLEELSLLKNEESDSRLKIEPSDFFQESTYIEQLTESKIGFSDFFKENFHRGWKIIKIPLDLLHVT